MLIDAAELVDGEALAADLCIVGGGLAGIALASTFFDTDTRVMVLESGPVGESADADALSDGPSTGHPYVPLHEGAPRRLGGAADLWGAWCRPFDPIDFEPRRWAWSGWPVTAVEMAPYYEKAVAFLRMSTRGFSGEAWADSLPPLYRHIQEATDLEVGIWQESPLAPISEVYLESLTASANVTVYVGATATEVLLGPDGDSVEGIEIAGADGRRRTARARQYVLASGALGSPRLLLASTGRDPAGVGNGHGHVGRFFAEHPHIVAGRIPLSPPAATGRPRFDAIDRGLRGTTARIEMERPGAGIRAGIQLPEDLRRKEDLLNVIAHLRPPSVEPPRVALEFFREVRHKNIKKILRGIPGLLRHIPEVVNVVYRRLLRRPRELELYVQVETSPNPDSRIVLTEDKDARGMPRIELQWRIRDLDKELLARTVTLMASELEAMGLGHLEMEPWLTDAGDLWGTRPFGGLHLMGTTRMSVAPEDGVVDPNGRVHGVENLWVVGSSVFPTYGSANPGMTIAATTLRTAERVAAALGGNSIGEGADQART